MVQLVKIGVGLFVAAVLVAIGFTSRIIQRSFAADVLSVTTIVNRNNQGVVLLDRHGQPFFTLYAARPKELVPLSNIPPVVRHAVIAAEDKDFYHHRGISPRGMARSLWLNIQRRRFVYGGSTLTQQLVKNSLLNHQKKFWRKYQEIILALRLEQRYTKDEILAMYLNTVYFGSNAFGIEQAAQTYFQKNSAELTLAEASLLAGLLPAPSHYSPLAGGGELAKQRQQYVLNAMVDEKYITPAEREAAQSQTLTIQAEPDPPATAPHFALMVRQLLIDQYGENAVARSGMRVKTTLDPAWQAQAEVAVQQHLTTLARSNASNGAAVIIDPATNEIRALVGSKSWHEPTFGKVNMALSPRQTGSTFKPIVYAAAFEQGVITPSTVLQDKPTVFGRDYRPQNYDRRFRGPVLARRALANSLNVPAVEVTSRVGVREVVQLAKRMGISSLPTGHDTNFALGLGAGEINLLELTNAYSIFANQGKGQAPVAILSIHDKYGRQAYEHQNKTASIVRPEVAFMISSILSDPQSRAETFGRTLTISRPAAVKTGTTQDYRDAWTVGYTPQVAVGVWIGNNDNRPMHQLAGALGAAPLWRELMETVSRDLPPSAFAPPPGIVTRYVCRYNGLLLTAATEIPIRSSRAGYQEYFVAGTEPTKRCVPPVPSPSPTPELADGEAPPASAPEPLTQHKEAPAQEIDS